MSSGFWVRSVSFVNDDVSCAIELADAEGNYYKYSAQVFEFIAGQRGLIAHNAQFEMGVTYAMTDQRIVPHVCTLAMSRYLANEGSPNQAWGLKDLASELLGEHYKGYDSVLPKSREMAKADWDVLGYYNQIDSHCTWYLYKMMAEVLDSHDWGTYFWQFLEQDFRTWLDLHFQSYINGLYVDVLYTESLLLEMEEEIEQRKLDIFNHEDIKPFVEEFNNKVVQAQQEKVDSKPKMTSKGDISKNWEKAATKLELIKNSQHFNLDSPSQLSWLLYNKLECPVDYVTDTSAPSTAKKALAENVKYGKMILDYRDTVSYFKFLRSVVSNTDKDGMIRINTKTPGTLTGRASSGSVEEQGA